MSRRNPRKTLQLCAQVRRALQMALLGDCSDELLQDASIETVEPAPDDRRMRVVLAIHSPRADLTREEVQARIEAVRGPLLDEVARSINRRKMPELVFKTIRGPLDEP